MTALSEIFSLVQHQLSALSKDDQSAKLIQQLLTEGQLHHKSTWAAHMTPAIAQPALLGKLLAGLHNGNLLSPELYPQLAAIEQQLLDWFCQLFEQPLAHFTHGSSYGNLDALWQARECANNSSTTVYGSQAAHYSISKACRILGLNFQAIPSNQLGQIDVKALRNACQLASPMAIVVTAGTTSCGAIDSIPVCIDIAKEFNSWGHIDAAWGGALMLSLKHQHHLTGIGQADSVCIDPHKALGQPKPCSLLLYKQSLTNSSDIDVDYLTQPPKQSIGGSYGGELFLPLWCSLILNGKQSFSDLVDQRLEQAELFAHALKQKSNWWVLHSATGIVCFRPSIDVDLTHLINIGQLSTAKVNGQEVYRVVFSSHTSQAKPIFTALEPFFNGPFSRSAVAHYQNDVAKTAKY
jgi:glutamate/tyrosine decarboxylase-like PLP-dependent enzyme